ncbi:MAG: ubiquinone biosynthesis methyltransferase UbiE [Ignavibacteria bacterium RBG_16_35_7]|jgi:ubiquinone/menaquinone biosynthesis C-methylase UbiE|nr:MAG: ubiquinone biosynthesis methyltransferase UbiE [Ignavibacteria bacterium RBG_16_35_7]
MKFYSSVIIPFFYDYLMDSPKINEGRKSLLSKITEEEILEIGFGTGINLKYYPRNVKKIIGVDANNGMIQQAQKKISNGRIEIELINQSSEALLFPDNTINAVVSAYTLCSIKDIHTALKEINRVLKPGGKYYFLEHGLADNLKTQKWQHRLNPIQNFWSDGCNLNRNIKSLIIEAGFNVFELKNYYIKRDPKIVGYMYEGIAIK